MTEKFLPHRALIDQFGAGGFRFGGYSHLGGIMILPSGMRAFAKHTVADFDHTDLQPVLNEKEQIDFLLIGTGASIQRLPKSFQDLLRAEAINFDTMSTSAAVSTYNVILAEGRQVAAIMLPVERPHERPND